MKHLAIFFGTAALCFLYACSSQISQQTEPTTVQSEMIPYETIGEIKQSMVLMFPSEADEFLIETIPKIQGGITCDDLAEMLLRVKFSDAAKVIKAVAGYVRRPFSEDCFTKIANVTESSESAGAIFNLYRSEPKY